MEASYITLSKICLRWHHTVCKNVENGEITFNFGRDGIFSKQKFVRHICGDNGTCQNW